MFELLKDKEFVTSLELVEIINELRVLEGNDKKLLHKNIIAVIEKEFSVVESNGLNFQPVEKFSYADKKNELRKAYRLTLKQAKRVLLRESVYVRSRIVDYIEQLETTILEQRIEIAILHERETAMALTHREKLEHTKFKLYPVLQEVGFYDYEYQSVHREILKRLYGGKWENIMKSDEYDIKSEIPKYRAEAKAIMKLQLNRPKQLGLFEYIEENDHE